MDIMQPTPDFPLPVPVQLRHLAELLENTSKLFRSDAEKARAMADRMEQKAEIQNVR